LEDEGLGVYGMNAENVSRRVLTGTERFRVSELFSELIDAAFPDR
jgi:hypothetical protein